MGEKRLTAKTSLQQPWILKSCKEPQLDFQPMVSALRSWLVAPALLRACMSMMAWTLTNEQQAMVRDHFLAIDSNHDGAVSLVELKDVMVDKHDVPEEEVNAIFTIFTAAHDREIHYSDFLAAMACETIELDDDLLHSTFSRFDTKGVGHITARDFHDLLGASLKDGHADAFVREADIEGCGSIHYIGFAEYVRSARLKMKSLEAKAFSIAQPQPSPNPTLLGSPWRIGSEKKTTEIRDSTTEDLEMKDACCVLM